jgi:amino acid adenylation domain-containing protein
LLESIVADPDEAIDRLEMLDESERRDLLAAGAPARVEMPARCLHEGFEAQAAARPDAVAVACDGRTLTYAAVDRAATALALRLQRLGVGPEVRVGVHLERSLELPIAMLAVMKAGGGYVPLDPELPLERLHWLIADTAAPVVVTQRSLRERLPRTGVHLVEVATEHADDPAGAELTRSVQPDNLAYIIHTSGSTGTPKGVQVTHANVSRLFSATEETFRFTRDDVSTLFHSSAFDFSVWELWSAWLYGGRVVIVPRDAQRSPDAFYRLLVGERVTVLNQTPSAFRHLSRVAIAAADRSELNLRLVIFGGEALEVSQLQPWMDRFGDAAPRMINMYGITETTVHVTERRLSRPDLDRPWMSPIGRPLTHLRAHVLDRRGDLVPFGIPGMLYVGGAGLARGYLGSADLTADRFGPDPFHGAPGERLYRTGDLARVTTDGQLEFLGRADHQLKVRGFRIESGEIEAALQRHPSIGDAVVIGRRDRPGETRIVAYIVVAPGARARVEELRRWLAERLPEYMIPAEFVVLDALPRTAGGKPDRRALPAPRGERPELEREYAAPRGALEETIATMWADVLRVTRVGVHDNFFSLGGNSLLLAQLHGTLQEHVSPGIPMVSLFKYPTVRAFAEHLQSGSVMPPGVQHGLARATARRRSMQHRLAARPSKEVTP